MADRKKTPGFFSNETNGRIMTVLCTTCQILCVPLRERRELDSQGDQISCG